MRIAVTGASGFIGTELLAELKERDHTVIALTRGGSARANSPYCVWRETDYTEESLAKALDGADAVIHLAGVRGTTSDPDDYVINEIMTVNLIKGMVSAGVKRIVFASTISVYDDVDTIPWTEDSPLKGRTMYGESKIKCEDIIRTQAICIGYTYGIVRIAQVMGLGERRRGMMNVFIDAASAGGELKVDGRSIAKRQYIYIGDLVKILIIMAENNDNVIINAGMPNSYTNLEIANIINRVYGEKAFINYDDSHDETIKSAVMSTQRLKNCLKYYPVDMEPALLMLKESEEEGK